jgi:hypothetical protein
MNTALLTGRYTLEYARRPINLVLLVVVPVVFVVLAAGAITDFAGLVGGVGDGSALAAPTAAWAAAFLAGVAGFFHVIGSAGADRRLAGSGYGAVRVVVARMVSGLGLALTASAGALVALMLRTSVADPLWAAVAGTVMAGAIYVAIGVVVGSVMQSEINGSLVVIFVWMVDVFLGPAMAGSDIAVTRLFPTHFVTLIMMDLPSGHAGPLGETGWALIWALGSLTVAGVVFTAATRPPRSVTVSLPGWAKRLGAALRYGMREYRRNVAMWIMLAAMPVFFITLSIAVTPAVPSPVRLTDAGSRVLRMVSMADIHGAIMVPITVAFLAGLAGLFVVQGSREADRRLAVAGFRSWEILGARLGVIALAAVLTSAVSLAITAVDFAPSDWPLFATSTVIVALTYGMLGVLAGSVFGRLGGLYVMFLVPFIDIGIAQNVMFSASPPAWGAIMPGRGAVQLLVDAAFTRSFDQGGALLLAAVWLIGVTAVAAAVFHRVSEPHRA